MNGRIGVLVFMFTLIAMALGPAMQTALVLIPFGTNQTIGRGKPYRSFSFR